MFWTKQKNTYSLTLTTNELSHFIKFTGEKTDDLFESGLWLDPKGRVFSTNGAILLMAHPANVDHLNSSIKPDWFSKFWLIHVNHLRGIKEFCDSDFVCIDISQGRSVCTLRTEGWGVEVESENTNSEGHGEGPDLDVLIPTQARLTSEMAMFYPKRLAMVDALTQLCKCKEKKIKVMHRYTKEPWRFDLVCDCATKWSVILATAI